MREREKVQEVLFEMIVTGMQYKRRGVRQPGLDELKEVGEAYDEDLKYPGISGDSI